VKVAPIVIFVYRRVIQRTIDSLLVNELASESDVFIFSDGFKNDLDKHDVLDVRNYLDQIKGFKSLSISYSKVNKGLADSVVSGVSEILNQYQSVIVIEDDLIVSRDYLQYMNEALNYYQDKNMIWSISGYGPNLPCLKNYSKHLYLSYRASSWGWATWKDRWDSVDWLSQDFHQFKKDSNLRKNFNLGGNDMFRMLELQMLGKIDSWAIRWCFSQFLQEKYSIYPTKSKVVNIGFDDSKGTHNGTDKNQIHSLTKKNKWKVSLDETKVDFFELELDRGITKCFKKYHDKNFIAIIGFVLKKKGGYRFFNKLYKTILKLLAVK
jgi:hypothetical protein